ncbi:MAG: helix-turn-helix domain-containing protein [Lachnospiraceae bacterium]
MNYKENKLQYAGASRFAYNWVLAMQKRTMKKVADSFQIQNSESKEIRKTETQITA